MAARRWPGTGSGTRPRSGWAGSPATGRGSRRPRPRPSGRSAAAGARAAPRRRGSRRPACPAASGSPAGGRPYPQRRRWPSDRPERAGRVEPRVVPGLERRGRVDGPGRRVPGGPASGPGHVGALHGVVDGELVLVLDALLVILRYQPAGGAAVQVGAERRGQARPVAVVVAADQERVVE